jgi:hypothetical protein
MSFCPLKGMAASIEFLPPMMAAPTVLQFSDRFEMIRIDTAAMWARIPAFTLRRFVANMVKL